MNIFTLSTTLLFAFGSFLANAGEFTLVSLHFLSSHVIAEWRIGEKELAANVEWSAEQGIPPMDPFRAGRLAKEAMQSKWDGEELVVERIEIKHMLFLNAFRAKPELGKNRWFYVVEAKPKSHVSGKPIEKAYQLVAVVLFDGTVVLPTLKKMDSPPGSVVPEVRNKQPTR